MKMNQISALALVIIALAACNQGAPSNANAPTVAAIQPTNAPTLAPPTVAPAPTLAATIAPAPISGGDLTEAEMLKIMQTSFAAYPWRMKQNAMNKSTKQSVEGMIEAQSPERAHVVTHQSVASSDIILDTILISPTLYVKATGAPANTLKQFGMTEGQWAKVPKTSPVASLAELAVAAASPLKLLESFGMGNQVKAQTYKRVGAEQVSGAPTNIYEWKASSTSTQNATVSYRVSIGINDKRIYKMISDGPLNLATTTVEYDASIKVTAPIP